MTAELLLPFRLFDPNDDVHVVDRRLPHWSQPGTIAFITFRTADSMPRTVLDQWFTNRANWLIEHGIDPLATNWRERLGRLDPRLATTFRNRFWNRWQDTLDAGHGACVLQDSGLSAIVEDSLRHFDGQRYRMFDFVIMPNHVHLLACFPEERAMLVQCESWKRYTATRINRELGQSGRFWQQDDFDHLVRSDEQFLYLRRYIAQNPSKAHLAPHRFRHFSRPTTPP